uniref:Hook C-terminal domain-containing protein n=1 Tax=Glossina morsitans morsitans TaxID=37546 RepID=A0A1B0GBD1_GLOMM
MIMNLLREDLRLKCQRQETELQLLQARLEELSAKQVSSKKAKTTAELAQLKDEVDFLRGTNEQLKIYEAQINGYKRKLEDYSDLKKYLKLLEEGSADYVQQI